ncbi:hypothetical protein V8F06_011098 [Rhypophila decipiens]
MPQEAGDNRVLLAIQERVPGAPKKRSEVEPLVARIFVHTGTFDENHPPPPRSLAGAMRTLKLTAGKASTADGGATIGPISLLNALRLHLIAQSDFYEDHSLDWIQDMTPNMFAAFFLVLRSARLRWHRQATFPNDLKQPQPSCLPKAIDAFNEDASMVEWGGMETILWLRDGKMWLDPRTEEEKKEGGEDNAGEAAGVTASDMDEIVKMLGVLCIDIAPGVTWGEDIL